ncbi:MAG: peroxiredoxin [Gammaproteobacteria bacterium]|nr:peroxiredoxin [Gammaproteobacteria bacterium]
MAKPRLGAQVPDFTVATTGGPFRLRAARGGSLVLYFYPRDNTSGCTREAEAFRDLHPRFRRAGAVILGVSPDSLDSHQRFRAKLSLPFELASDPEHELATCFGAWTQKTLYGRRFMGIERSTFWIDARGVLQAEWRKVRVAGHAEAVLAAVTAA